MGYVQYVCVCRYKLFLLCREAYTIHVQTYLLKYVFYFKWYLCFSESSPMRY